MRRLLLVRHAPTSATRSFAFPRDEDVDEPGRAGAARLAGALPPGAEVLCSPAARCRQTAASAGLADPLIEPALAECDFGAWAGRRLAELPAEVAREWMTEPDSAPHGGESLGVFAARVAAWLDDQAGRDGSAVAITHGGVVRAAVAHALEAPLTALWRIDAAPLAITELHARDGRWTVSRVNCA